MAKKVTLTRDDFLEVARKACNKWADKNLKEGASVGSGLAMSEFYSKDAGDMNAIMEDFTSAAGELQKAMDEIKESTTAVSAAVEESAKGIVNVAEMSTDLTGSVGDIQKAADHNNEIADLLDTEVKRFKLE